MVRRVGSPNWYYRENIPDDVRAILIARDGRAPTEVWRSLRTADPKTAKRAKVKVEAAQHKEWDDLRAEASKHHSVPTIAEMAEAAFEQVHARFITVHKEKLRHQFSQSPDIEGELRRRKQSLVQSTFLPSDSDRAAMEKVAAVICRQESWELRGDTPEGAGLWDELVRLVEKAVQLARAAIIDELEARPADTSRSTVMTRLGAPAVRKAAPGASITELFDLYASTMLRTRDKGADTLNADRKVIEQFAEFVGTDRDLATVTKPEVRDFRNALSKVPVKWTSRNDLRGLSLRQAAEQWRAAGGPVRSDKTVAKELSGLSAFYSWCVRDGYAEDNPTRDLAPKIDRKAGKYPPYSIGQLRSIFASPLFTSCSGLKGQEHHPGCVEVRDWRFWLPLSALYSGARIGELAQLECSDMRQEEGVWVFDINEIDDEDAEEVKRLKTEASRRLVPVHPTLLAAGLLDHVNQVRASGSNRLFPEIKRCARGTLSYEPSRFWQRYLKKLDLKQKGLALHSFRHTFTDECRRNGISDGILSSLLGHSKHSITAHYGTTAEGNLSQRMAAIDAITYGGLHAADLVMAAE